MEETSSAPTAPPVADRVWGPGWVVFGAAIMLGAWRTDRLQAQGVEWFAAPGLLPGILGLLIALTGVLIAVRARRSVVGSSIADPGDEQAWDLRRVGLTLLLCLGFAAGLVGRGLPFGALAGVYLFTHITLLQWPERRAAGQTLRGLALAAAVAVGGALIVPFIFESVFLVRLP